MYCRYQHAKILTQWREMRGCIIYQISDLNKYWIGNLETVRNAVSNYKKWLLSHLCCGGKQFIQVSIDCILAVVRVRLPTAAPPSSAFYTRDFTDGARAAADAPSCFLHQYMRFFTNTYSFHKWSYASKYCISSKYFVTKFSPAVCETWTSHSK